MEMPSIARERGTVKVEARLRIGRREVLSTAQEGRAREEEGGKKKNLMNRPVWSCPLIYISFVLCDGPCCNRSADVGPFLDHLPLGKRVCTDAK